MSVDCRQAYELGKWKRLIGLAFPVDPGLQVTLSPILLQELFRCLHRCRSMGGRISRDDLPLPTSCMQSLISLFGNILNHRRRRELKLKARLLRLSEIM